MTLPATRFFTHRFQGIATGSWHRKTFPDNVSKEKCLQKKTRRPIGYFCFSSGKVLPCVLPLPNCCVTEFASAHTLQASRRFVLPVMASAFSGSAESQRIAQTRFVAETTCFCGGEKAVFPKTYARSQIFSYLLTSNSEVWNFYLSWINNLVVPFFVRIICWKLMWSSAESRGFNR